MIIRYLLIPNYYSIFKRTRFINRNSSIFILPVIIAGTIYFLLNRENKILICLLGNTASYANSKMATIMKAIFYIIVMFFMLNIEVPMFKEFLLKAYKNYKLYTEIPINQGIDKILGERIFLTVY